MSTDTLKTAICDALAAWIRQRPGLEYGNYVSPGTISREQIESGRRAYFSEARAIARDKRDAETLLQAVRGRDGITGEQLLEAFKHAYSGRLSCEVTKRENVVFPDREQSHAVRLDYCTGQYWPTEYRKAAAAVLASCLWDYMRDNMPKASGTMEHDNVEGLTPG